MNLLRPSKINPLVSARAIASGHCDCRKHPLAPAGTRVVVHERPMDRGTWSDCGVDGHFVDPAMQHHRNSRCLVSSTNDFRTGSRTERSRANSEHVGMLAKTMQQIAQLNIILASTIEDGGQL